jgi:hypothetical protein
MNDSSQPHGDPSADLLKQWQQFFTGVLQTAGTISPDTMPPEMLNQIRAGMFQALSKSWEDYMRSPQFLEGMKQMMENAVAFRQMSTEFLTRARHEMQGTSRQDVDDMLLAMREMEARLTRRVDDLAAQVTTAKSRRSSGSKKPLAATKKKSARRKTAAARKSARRRR